MLPRLKMHCLGISKNCLETKKLNRDNQNEKYIFENKIITKE